MEKVVERIINVVYPAVTLLAFLGLAGYFIYLAIIQGPNWAWGAIGGLGALSWKYLHKIYEMNRTGGRKK